MQRLVGKILDFATASVPDRIAVTLGQEALTFRQVDMAANRLCHTLAAQGVRAGDRIAVWSTISLDDPALYFAIMRLGATYVPLNPAYSAEEAGAVLAYITPRLLLCDRIHFEVGQALYPKACLLFREQQGDGGLVESARYASVEAPPPAHIDEEAIESIFLTSGSTGTPKGVMVSHRATWNRMFGRSRNDLCGVAGEVSMFPLFHFAGWAMLLSSWVYRRPIHLVGSASAQELLGAVEQWRAGVIYAIPSVWERLLDAMAAFDTSSLRYALTGTSRVDPVLSDRIRAALPHTRMSILYGSTEMGGALAIHDDEEILRKPGSVGFPHPGFEARLEDGELQLRADTMMSGYYQLPDATVAVMANGWYRTGDLAERDDEGYYTITGRSSEVIRSGGEYIAPVEVEAALSDAPGVAEVAIIGLSDPGWGEIVCAVVVPVSADDVPDLGRLRAHLAPRLAAFKHPRRLELVTSLPRTSATGQVQRSLVRNLITARVFEGV